MSQLQMTDCISMILIIDIINRACQSMSLIQIPMHNARSTKHLNLTVTPEKVLTVLLGQYCQEGAAYKSKFAPHEHAMMPLKLPCMQVARIESV
jgi:hypothetical protein